MVVFISAECNQGPDMRGLLVRKMMLTESYLNIRILFYQYMIPIIKIRRSHDRLLFMVGVLMFEKTIVQRSPGPWHVMFGYSAISQWHVWVGRSSRGFLHWRMGDNLWRCLWCCICTGNISARKNPCLKQHLPLNKDASSLSESKYPLLGKRARIWQLASLCLSETLRAGLQPANQEWQTWKLANFESYHAS